MTILIFFCYQPDYCNYWGNPLEKTVVELSVQELPAIADSNQKYKDNQKASVLRQKLASTEVTYD